MAYNKIVIYYLAITKFELAFTGYSIAKTYQISPGTLLYSRYVLQNKSVPSVLNINLFLMYLMFLQTLPRSDAGHTAEEQ